MINRHRTWRYRSVGAAVGILLTMGLGPLSTTASASTPVVSLPQDEGPHNTTKEWWYTTGHLTGVDASGNTHKYGYEYVVFRNGGPTYPQTSPYIAQLAVTDLTTGAHVEDQRIAVEPNQFPSAGGFNVPVAEWQFAGRGGSDTVNAALTDNSYGLQLATSSAVPAALHGDGGLIPYGPFGTSYYYSYTNMKVSGVVTDHGVPVAVNGDGWFDHQWFNTAPVVAGWDWFSGELSNGTQYMVYLIKDSSGQIAQRVGTLVNRDGSTVNLDPNSLDDQALSTWTSPHTGQVYSSGWKVSVPGGNLTIKPRMLDQEMYMLPLPHYWEGDSSITGTINGEEVAGAGYTEIFPPQLLAN